MRSTQRALLCVSLFVSGCGATAHGPATRVVSTTTHLRNVGVGSPQDFLGGAGEVDRETVQESRLSDAEGREWTESKVVKTERVSRGQIEAELFEQALQASAVREQQGSGLHEPENREGLQKVTKDTTKNHLPRSNWVSRR